MAAQMSKSQPRGRTPDEDQDSERMRRDNQNSGNEKADRGETQNEESAVRESPTQQKHGSSTRVHRDTLIIGLNHDLAGEYQAILMYTHYSAKVIGPYRKELRALFRGEVTDEQGHAQFLADKIAALGGEPTTQPRPVITTDNPRAILENALAAEKQAIADYRVRIDSSRSFGDVGLKVELENQIADETRHKEEMERILAGWETSA